MIWWKTNNSSKTYSLLYLFFSFPNNTHTPRGTWLRTGMVLGKRAVHFPGPARVTLNVIFMSPCRLGTMASSQPLRTLQANTRLQLETFCRIYRVSQENTHLSCCAHGPQAQTQGSFTQPLILSCPKRKKETSILKINISHSVATVGAKRI